MGENSPNLVTLNYFLEKMIPRRDIDVCMAFEPGSCVP
jgi:hypothetical protein